MENKLGAVYRAPAVRGVGDASFDKPNPIDERVEIFTPAG